VCSDSVTPSRGPRFDAPVVWLLSIVALGTAIRLPHLGGPPSGDHLFRQTQTLFGVQGQARQGIDLARSYLPVFGDATTVPFEFPLYQASSALFTHLGLSIEASSRLVALIAFQGSAILLWALLRRWHGSQAAVASLILFELIPFGLRWGTVPLIDFSSLALGLLGVWSLFRWFGSGWGPFLVMGCLSTWLSLLVKVTTFPTVGLLLLLGAYLAYRDCAERQVSRRIGLAMALGPGVGVILTWGWTAHADSVKAASPFTSWLTSPALNEWNFGTAAQRLDSDTYALIIGRAASDIAGPGCWVLVAAIAAAVGWGNWRQRAVVVGFSLAMLASPLIFINLYYVHDYYLIATYPAIIGLCAMGIAALAQRLREEGSRDLIAVVGAVVVVGSVLTSQRSVSDLQALVAPSPPRLALVTSLQQATSPDDSILVVGCDWDPTVLYLSQRRGLMLRRPPEGKERDQLDREHFDFLASCGENVELAPYVPTAARVEDSSVPQVFELNYGQH
jgi:hypothetical protein